MCFGFGCSPHSLSSCCSDRPVRSLAVMELSRLSCWSVVASSLPPPPPPEHTDDELSTARPSASSTSLSIRSLDTLTLAVSLNIRCTEFKGVERLCLRHARVAAVLFLSESILLHKDVKALRLFPHVVKRHTFGDRSCCDLRSRVTMKYGFRRVKSDTFACLLEAISTTYFVFLDEVKVLVVHL